MAARPMVRDGAEEAPPHHEVFLWLPPGVAVKAAIDPGTIALKTDGASLGVAPPGFLERLQLRIFQRRFDTGGSEDHANAVLAGAIDRVPERADFVRRHPVLRI